MTIYDVYTKRNTIIDKDPLPIIVDSQPTVINIVHMSLKLA